MKEDYLKPIRGPFRIHKPIVYDLESKAGITQHKGFTRPFLVGHFDGETYRAFRNPPGMAKTDHGSEKGTIYNCIDKYLKFLFGLEDGGADARKRFQSDTCRIYACNGGKFDHLFALGWLLYHRESFGFEITSQQSKIQRLDVWVRGERKRLGEWTFLDSVSLLPMSLKRLGKTFCPEDVQKMSFDLDRDDDDPLWEVYNELDCRVLHKGLVKFAELMARLGSDTGVTAPSTAMRLFRRKFQGRWIEISPCFDSCENVCHGREFGCSRLSCEGECHGCLHAFIRLAYYGGRTELFRPYGWNLLYFDLNSSYPTSMLAPMPVGRAITYEKLSWAQCQALAKKKVGFIECTVEIPSTCNIPPLPYRDVATGKLTFPIGRFSGTWDFAELELLSHPRVNGKVVEIRKSVWFDAVPVFKGMVETLYQFRQKHDVACKWDACKGCNPLYDPGLAEVAKLMLNSLYGKFGMDPERCTLVLQCEGDARPKHAWPTTGDENHCLLWEKENIADVPYIIPQISAHITALSRVRLFLGMMSVVAQGGTVYYVDTDSILSDKPVSPQGGKLGEWKREEPGVLLEGEFVRPKLYRIRAHVQGCIDYDCPGCWKQFHKPTCDNDLCKGCAESKQRMKGIGGRQQTSKNFDRLLQGEEIVWDRVMQHKTLLKMQNLSPMTVEGRKSLLSPYDKRILHADGTTSPRKVVTNLRKDA